MLWKTGHNSHQHHPRNPRPTLICIPPQQIYRWHNLYCTPHCLFPSGQKEHLCDNAVHWLQLSVQHHRVLKLITTLRSLRLNTWILDLTLQHTHYIRSHTCILMPHTQRLAHKHTFTLLSYPADTLLYILIAMSLLPLPTCTILYYLNYLVHLHVDSYLYSLCIAFYCITIIFFNFANIFLTLKWYLTALGL